MTDRHTPEQVQAIVQKFKEQARAVTDKPFTPEELERAEKRKKLAKRSQCKWGQAVMDSALMQSMPEPIEEGE